MRRTDVVLIPGIGGHPRFHEGFIRALEQSHTVHTAAHVDFFAAAEPDFEAHVEHWRRRVERVGGRPVIVGVSFGAHVGLALRRRLPAEAVGGLVLVSYWPLAGWQRAALRRLRRLPRLGTFGVGMVCLRWSEWTAADRGGLLAQRRELYDDERAAKRRLFARLVSLADAPATAGRDEAAFVYAAREPALRYARRRFGGRLPDRTVVVAGTHAVSLAGSTELTAAVDRLIAQEPSRFEDQA